MSSGQARERFMKRCLVFLSLILGLWACEDDQNQTKLQFMPDMVDTPVAKYHRSYIDSPEFSVAYNALIYPKTAEEAEQFLINPLKADSVVASHLRKGKHLYESVCSHCHGITGAGDGPVTKVFPRPPSFLQDASKDRGDGFYFHRITFGTDIMPYQGHALDPKERWQIVMYIRELQESAK